MKLSDIYIRDPYILPYEGVYYMYGKKEESETVFWVYKSIDLEDWSEPKTVFVPPVGFWANRDFWAPEVHPYKGKFYMFASFKSEKRHRGTQILVSEKPDGMFVPLIEEPITPIEWECLDGTLYIDKKGQPHIVFCHEWTQIGNGTVCAMELSDDLKTAKSSPKVLWSASQHTEIINSVDGIESKITDGPFIYRLKSGELICIWSSCNKHGYMELISRSDNRDIDGVWTIDKEPLFAQDGGHGMIFETFNGSTMFVMHCPNEPTKERAVIKEIIQDDMKIFLK